MTNAVPNLPPLALPPITPHAIRDELIAMIVSDLLGPAGGPEEELDHLETNGSDDAEVGATEASAPSPTAFFPNSVGMSFVVESDSKAILIKTDWGRLPQRDAPAPDPTGPLAPPMPAWCFTLYGKRRMNHRTPDPSRGSRPSACRRPSAGFSAQ